MAFRPPGVIEIKDRLIAEFETEFGIPIPVLKKSFLRLLAAILAPVIFLLYRRAEAIQKNLFATTAENNFLTDIGSRYGVVRKNAVAYQGVIAFSDIPSGTILRSVQGFEYSVIGAQSNDAGIIIQAINSGATGTLGAESTLTLTVAIPNIERRQIVIGTIVEGADEESDASLRKRILQKQRLRPQGGSLIDYKTWAEEVDEVSQGYPYSSGSGFVDIYIESRSPDRIATDALQGMVRAYIREPERKPLGAFVRTHSVTIRNFTVTITGLENGLQENAIEKNIRTYLEARTPGDLSAIFTNTSNQILQTEIVAIIDQSSRSTTVTISENGSISGAQVLLGEGELAGLANLVVI